MITVQWWSEERQAYYCTWDSSGCGYLNEEDLKHEQGRGEEVIWECGR
ncbi:hypothetical protein ACXOL9_004075 [Vibrio parahaemolyticus]|nr:hypothetical protein [Vibrio parahaemolyticus]EMC9391316.1 hypothetical protein [Vibrio parahaemolyticus]